MPSDLGLQVRQQRKALNTQETRQLSTCLSHPNTYFCPPLLHWTAVLLALSLRFLFLLSSPRAAPRNPWLGSGGVWVPPAHAPEVWGARGAQGAGQGPPSALGVGARGARTSPPLG